MSATVKPYHKSGKKEEVEQMFDHIAHRYDFLNRLFSLRIDTLWRKRALRLIQSYTPADLLDVATGTADFAIAAAAMIPSLKHIKGVDLSEGMLSHGRIKVSDRQLEQRIELIKGDSEQLPFADDSFDAVTVAFGVRNFENLSQGLTEMHRVLRPGSPIVVLEFSKPQKFPVKQLFGFYFKRIMPVVGRVFSKDHRAYTYLPESVDQFPSGQAFLHILSSAGFREVYCIPLSGGITSIYTGVK
ncbi:MAG: bifunctional demethylmenaquinone methyltransferase/2-methoxy-6-polyprenyl-1,4-benzoquinol methylase UbiE [Flavobacteriales bacterium]|jgi:demethylmenaquinone methyltransferase/2-methoxy-6-polyprenyl-1,4-benzoquinol methylase